MTNKSRPHDLKRIRLLRGNPMAGKIHRQAKKNGDRQPHVSLRIHLSPLAPDPDMLEWDDSTPALVYSTRFDEGKAPAHLRLKH
jgi:hypothetical protein